MFVVLLGSVLTTLILLRDILAGDGGRRLHPPARALALVHRALRQLRRGDGRRAGQGAGRRAARYPDGDAGEADAGAGQPPRLSVRVRHRAAARRHRPGRRPATSSPATARSSKAWRRWTSRRSPANRRRSSASPAATARRSRAAPRCCPTGWSSQVTANPGETFLDRMIALVEGATRQKTPNEIALTILLSGLTVVFLLAVVTLQPFAVYSGSAVDGAGAHRAARLPHSHHDRRAALRHRHRGHGPDDPAERDRA